MKLIRDESTTSSYWAAVNTLCPMPDVHVIADAPIGCYNLVGVAVIDYTDAVPYLRNFTPTDLTEKAISSSGTTNITRDTIDKLIDTGKTIIVMSTAESEMVGADHTGFLRTQYPQIKFFASNSLIEDEWTGRDRMLGWLYDNYDAGKSAIVETKSVSIIGPTYGCFNSPSDLAEIKRLVAGVGGVLKHVFPMESNLADISDLKNSDVMIVMYKEFGETLAKKLQRPHLFAPFGLAETEAFILELGKLLGTEEQSTSFLAKEKKTTARPIWDLWLGPQAEWFPTIAFGVVASQTYAEGLKHFLQDELGMQCKFSLLNATADNTEVRNILQKNPPQIMFGRIVDKIYLAEVAETQRSKPAFIPAAFPGPIVRRALGTPFMGFSGAVYLVQEIVNILYDTLFNFLPLQKNNFEFVDETKKFVWQPEALKLLDARIEKAPFISRISVSRELKTKAELYAQKIGVSEITAAVFEKSL
jgi:chlorophyllide a reductase subunit Z